MPILVQSVGHTFEVADIAYRAVPQATAVFNELDYHGTLLGLQRLPTERNLEYKQRLLDVYVHRANSSYTGLVNGLTRELGLQFFNPIEITVRNDFDPTLTPRIEFVDNTVKIWSDVLTQELEMSFQRSNETDSVYFITGLVDKINTSTVFEATLLDAAYTWKRSDTILNQSSSKLVQAQVLLPSRINYLGNSNIEKGSLIFNNTAAFRYEVEDKSLLTYAGSYFVDYTNGVITSFSLPDTGVVLRYAFREDVFQPTASPVIVRAVHSDEFQKVMFEQTQQSNTDFSSGIPTPDGSSIINELLSVVPMYWGP